MFYDADAVSDCDFYPFSSLLPGRRGQAGNYRYGFNGYESDEEVSGEGNSYTTTFRQYNPRFGRWMSKDPKVRDFESPYASYANNPILFSDPLGDTIRDTAQK